MNEDDYNNLKEFEKNLNKMKKDVNTVDGMVHILRQSIIGLCTIALAHIDNGDIDKARETILGTIIAVEGGIEE